MSEKRGREGEREGRRKEGRKDCLMPKEELASQNVDSRWRS